MKSYQSQGHASARLIAVVVQICVKWLMDLVDCVLEQMKRKMARKR